MARIRSLDSLRGLAALVVVFYHFSLVLPSVPALIHTIYPLRVITAGIAAVYVFFVLSGFVLFHSLQRHAHDGWTSFACRRLTRLYPPVAAAVLMSALLYRLVDPASRPQWSGWISQYSWTEAPNLKMLAGHLLLLDPDRFHTLDNPMWSLVVEMRLSLLFPFLALAVKRQPLVTLLVSATVSLASRQFMAVRGQPWIIDPLYTLQYLDLFAIGAVMACKRDMLVQATLRVPAWLVCSAIFVGLMESWRYSPYVMYISATLLVAASISYSSLGKIYALRPLVWLGKRSFSLYLVHVPILLAIVHGFSNFIPIGILLAAGVPLCLAAAEIFWLLVEEPSMRWSQSIGRRP